MVSAFPFLDAHLALRRRDFDLDVRLRLGEHERLGVIGPNGAGKSTLVNLLAGHLSLSGGYIRLAGRTLAATGGQRVDTPAHRRGVVLLSQEPRVFGHLSVRANIEYGPRAHGLPRAQARRRAEELIERFELAGLAERPGHALSGGQAQRVALARTLAVEPRLLLLDEPFAALDAATAAELRQTLVGLLDERGTTTVFVSHSLLDVVAVAGRLAVIEAGGVADEGACERVLFEPGSDFAADLSGISVLTGRLQGGGFVGESGWAVPLPSCPQAGPARLFVPPEALTVRPADESSGDNADLPGGWRARVLSVATAPAGLAAVVRPIAGSPTDRVGPAPDQAIDPVKLSFTSTASWLKPGLVVIIWIDHTKTRVSRPAEAVSPNDPDG